MKILVIGDVTSPSGVEHLKKNLWKFREQKSIDFCVVNGENASFITGISPELAEVLLRAGADCITGGNHTLRNKKTYTYLDDVTEILRPVNFGEDAPGRGYTILDCNGYRILVINALGRVHMDPMLDSPFTHIDKVLRACEGKYDFAILDFHAEATGEKMAIGYAYDGKINIVFGTHTHVQTADGRFCQAVRVTLAILVCVARARAFSEWIPRLWLCVCAQICLTVLRFRQVNATLTE